MIPVPDLLALLAEQADNGDEDAAIQLNALALQYSPEVLLSARNAFPAAVDHSPPVITRTAPVPVITAVFEPTLGDLLASCFAQTQADNEWALFEAATDMIANHYRLSRDAVFDAMLELELKHMEDGGGSLASGPLAEPDGFSKIGLEVARMLMIEADANALPLLTMTIH